MPKFIILYKNGCFGEAEIFEGTLEEAKAEALRDHNFENYGRQGVEIYEISEPVFEKAREWSP